jgi:type II secretory pathway predicted ATPase ExeA
LALPRYPARTLYLRTLGFSEDPFNPTPDPRFLCLTSQHGPLLERLFSMVERSSGLAVVDGHSGVGKSIVARRLESYYLCQPDEYCMAYLYNIPIDTEYAVLSAISAELSLSRRKGVDGQWDELSTYIRSQATSGRATVIVVDTQDDLTKEALTQLHEIASHLAPVVVFGKPSLTVALARVPDAAEQAHRYTLADLDLEDTVTMIDFRCMVAGRKTPIFSSEALMYIWEATYGNPGDVINICGRVLNAMGTEHLDSAALPVVTAITQAYLEVKLG